MTPEQKLQGLLRLKQHEQPPAEYFEEFLAEFHQRQREGIMKQGALSLFWERFATWAGGMSRPSVIWGAAGAYAAVILLVCLWPKPGPSGSTVLLQLPTALPTAQRVPADPAAAPLPRNRNAIPVSNQQPQSFQTTGEKQKSAAEIQPESPDADPAPTPTPLPVAPEPKTRDL